MIRGIPGTGGGTGDRPGHGVQDGTGDRAGARRGAGDPVGDRAGVLHGVARIPVGADLLWQTGVRPGIALWGHVRDGQMALVLTATWLIVPEEAALFVQALRMLVRVQSIHGQVHQITIARAPLPECAPETDHRVRREPE